MRVDLGMVADVCYGTSPQDEMKGPPHEAVAGFPDHPHRGFETCSIMLSGRMEHRDSFGNHVRSHPASQRRIVQLAASPCGPARRSVLPTKLT